MFVEPRRRCIGGLLVLVLPVPRVTRCDVDIVGCALAARDVAVFEVLAGVEIVVVGVALRWRQRIVVVEVIGLVELGGRALVVAWLGAGAGLGLHDGVTQVFLQ